MKTWQLATLASLALCLAACGGDGGVNSVSSAPPPPSAAGTATTALVGTSIEKVAPLSDRAGLTDGSYSLKAVIDERTDGVSSSRILAPGDAKLEIDAATRTYTLTVNAADFPSGQAFDLENPYGPLYAAKFGPTGFGYHIIQTDHLADGTTSVNEFDNDRCCGYFPIATSDGKGEFTGFYLDIRHRYLTLGYWFYDVVEMVGSSGFRYHAEYPHRKIDFVQGIRTEPGDIPASGKASYVDDAGFLHFDADFAARTIAASIDIAPYHDPEDPDYDVTGVSAHGSAPITGNGDFLIALAGSYAQPDGSAGGTLTGKVDGAFYGPQAAEIGGVYQLLRDGTPTDSGAFGGAKN